MNIEEFYTSFCSQILKWMGSNPVSATNIESASKMFEGFAKYNLRQDRDSLVKLAHASYQYFLLIVKYAQHRGKITSHHECQLDVKIALNSFMFVINKTKTCSKIIRCLSTNFFDQLFKEFGEFDFIEEFLKVYLACLNIVPKRVLDQIVCRLQYLHLLAETFIEAHETNMQIVIISILLKFSHDSGRTQLENLFPRIGFMVRFVVEDTYQRIRMFLEELNGNSIKKIFSIHCRSVTLDDLLVLEYEGSTLKNGVWLDVDLPFKTLSFFCSPTILSELTSDITFGLTTNWEFVSFRAEDCLEAKFTRSYEETKTSETLEIYIQIKASKINLFRKVKCDKILHLMFKISSYSIKYSTLINVIMPQIFPNFADNCREVVDPMFSNSLLNLLLDSSDESDSLEMEHPLTALKRASDTEELEDDLSFDFGPEDSDDERFKRSKRPSAVLIWGSDFKPEIKDEPSSPSPKKTPAAQDDWEMEDRDIEARNDAVAKQIVGREIAERLFGIENKNAALESGVQEYNYQGRDPRIVRNLNSGSNSGVQGYKNEESGGKSDDKPLKTCDKKVAVVSALSVQSSSSPSRVPVATPSNERKRAVTATQSSAKKPKENEDASNWTIEKSSNIVGKEADKNILQPKSSNTELKNVENLSRCFCCMLSNKKNCALLDFMSKHAKTRTNK